ncbi:MAG: hypothetical protein J0H57_20565, partial [Rhodospirillales bacterium]|nr:hypothetical protein [Rhodospirillales bacterium]
MATPLIDSRLSDLLGETRLVMLGSQLLLGLQYRAAFAQTFDSLPPAFKTLDAAALLLILATTALLLGTPALHRIADDGHASVAMVHRASFHLKLALLPFALAFGLDAAIGFVRPVGPWGAGLAGGAFVLGAGFAWYGFPMLIARQSPEEPMQDKQLPLETRIVQSLTELRVIVPGAQALFGFQFTAVLTQSFAT